MKPAFIFLNGYYDTRHLNFYRQEIENAAENRFPLICADGGIRIFDELNQREDTPLVPDILIGDMDSASHRGSKPLLQAKQTVQEWVGKTDKDYTDGQLAVDYALEQLNCRHIIIYGGLPRPEEYETDHFLGNFKLMRFGHYRVSTGEPYTAEMRDPRQTIHYVLSAVRLTRKSSRLQRVSLIAESPNVIVEKSENLRWDLASLHIHPDLTNALRNEFVEGAESATIQLTDGSAPVYVIHNW
jgi:thiamine pyrophosphokinase